MEKTNRAYLQSTIDIADNYVGVLVQDRSYYEKLTKLPIVNGRWNYTDIPEHPCFSVYLTYKNLVHDSEKQYFNRVVKLILNNYYAEEFGLTPVKIHVTQETNYLSSSSSKKPIQVKKLKEAELKVNTLKKYENQAKAVVTLIHGTPVEELTENDLIELIRVTRESKESIKDLIDDSKRMKEKYEKFEEDIKVYVEALDNLPK